MVRSVCVYVYFLVIHLFLCGIDLGRCQKLIDRGEDIDQVLHFAIGRGKLRIVDLLVKHDVDLHTEIREGDYWVPPPPPPEAPVS